MPDALTLNFTLHRAHQLAMELFAEKAGHDGITPRQAQVLHALRGMEGASQTAIVEATGIDRSTLADICRRLKAKGWIERRRTREDARTYALKLTPAGRSALNGAERAFKAVEGRLLARVEGLEHLRILPEPAAARRLAAE